MSRPHVPCPFTPSKRPKGATWHVRGYWFLKLHGKVHILGNRHSSKRSVESKREEVMRTKGRPSAAFIADTDRVTVERAASAYFAALEAKRASGRIAARTQNSREQYVNAFGTFIGPHTYCRSLSPQHFTSYMEHLNAIRKQDGTPLSPFTIDSHVSGVTAFMRWMEKTDIIDRFRPGDTFARPEIALKRDARLSMKKRFSLTEVAKIWIVSPWEVRGWIGLGLCCAFDNADIGGITRDILDLDSRIVDFRRRKTGKKRRLAILPRQLVAVLRMYSRPEARRPEWGDRFFLSSRGMAYNRSDTESGRSSNRIAMVFAQLMDKAGVRDKANRRGFKGLRTTFANTFNRRKYSEEYRIVIGRMGDMESEHYLERVGKKRVAKSIRHVWLKFASALSDECHRQGLPLDSVLPPVEPVATQQTA